jgi:hypothetical protein
MKTFKFIFVVLAAMGMAISCSDDKGFFDKDAIVYAAYLNVVATPKSTFGTVSQSDFRLNTTSEYQVTLEERDVERGKLFQAVDFYVKLRDNTVPKITTSEIKLKTVPSSAFAQDPNTDYPRATISITAQEVLTALSLTQGDVNGGDQIELRYELVMKDGRVFTNTNASGIVTGGAFFNSPFFYRIPVVCVSERTGTYDGVTDWVDYYGYEDTNTYTDDITAAAGAGQYNLADLSGGMEPIIWGNPPVEAVIQDLCGKVLLVSAPYVYPYYVRGGSEIDLSTGVMTIVWENVYGENGVTVLTPSNPN